MKSITTFVLLLVSIYLFTGCSSHSNYGHNHHSCGSNSYNHHHCYSDYGHSHGRNVW